MNTTTAVLITLTSLSLITSAATLTIMVVGAKKVQHDVEEVKTKMTKNMRHLQSTLSEMDF